MSAADHFHHMSHALRLARQGLGRVSPNPSVGCVLVKNDRIIGLGRTQDGGRPHAEAVALSMAGPEAKGAIAYVTLEPCNHDRPGGCCAQALIGAGVAEVYVACLDPDPRTAGQGIERLRAAGIFVHVGLCEKEALALNAGFVSRVTKGRPFITLKMAVSLDGRIATKTGSSQWITGPQARVYAHGLRAQHDAVLVGIGTVLADDPLLTTRLPGLSHPLVRVVLDSRLKIDAGSKLLQTAANDPLWIFCKSDKGNKKLQLEGFGAKVFVTDPSDLSSVVHALAGQGITRLLVEGGAAVLSSFIRACLYDELHWVQGAKMIGADGAPAVEGLGAESIDDAPGLLRREFFCLGDDVVTIYERKG